MVAVVAREGYTERMGDGGCCVRAGDGPCFCVSLADVLCDDGFEGLCDGDEVWLICGWDVGVGVAGG